MYLDIVYKKLVEPIGHHVSGLFIGPISDIGHKVLTLEPPTYTIVNPLGFPPAGLREAGGSTICSVVWIHT